MKAKLLKKVRSEIYITERNGKYYVQGTPDRGSGYRLEIAMGYYRGSVLRRARDVFGLKFKKRIN